MGRNKKKKTNTVTNDDFIIANEEDDLSELSEMSEMGEVDDAEIGNNFHINNNFNDNFEHNDEVDRELELAALIESGLFEAPELKKKMKKKGRRKIYNKKGMIKKLKDIQHNLPWPETLIINEVKLNEVDAHDDLEREVVFYNQALNSVRAGRRMLLANKLPYERPNDYFAEMIKTDRHMEKVKDRLLFEKSKMEAFEQRKRRQDERKYIKQLNQQRSSDKSRRKKNALEAVKQWRKENKKKGNTGKRLLDNDRSVDKLIDSIGGNKRKRGRNGDYNSKNKKMRRPGKSARMKKRNRRR